MAACASVRSLIATLTKDLELKLIYFETLNGSFGEVVAYHLRQFIVHKVVDMVAAMANKVVVRVFVSVEEHNSIRRAHSLDKTRFDKLIQRTIYGAKRKAGVLVAQCVENLIRRWVRFRSVDRFENHDSLVGGLQPRALQSVADVGMLHLQKFVSCE